MFSHGRPGLRKRGAAPGSEGGAAAVVGEEGKAPEGEEGEEGAEEEGEEEEEREEEEQEEGNEAVKASGSGGGAPEADGWEEDMLDPLKVRFTQDKVHPFFYRRGPIVNVLPKIKPVLHEAVAGDADTEDDELVELMPPFGPIHCLRRGQDIWSLDNRRLYALQMAAMEHWPRRCRIRVLRRDRLPRHKMKSQYRKFNTTSEGRIVSITARYQKFDTWSWFDRAVDIEWYHFSQRLGAVLSCFEILPVIGALLFRTGLTGFATRTPFVVGFVASFAVDVLRQKIPVLERSLCQYQVLAVTWEEVRPSGHCCDRVLQALRRIRGIDEDEETTPAPMSGPQIAATGSMVMLLFLPYFLAITHERARSSVLSCWLGIGCMLFLQLIASLRLLLSADTISAVHSLAGTAPQGEGTATGFGKKRGSGAAADEDEGDASPPGATSEGDGCSSEGVASTVG